VHLLFRILLHPEHGLSQPMLTSLWLSAGALAAAAGLVLDGLEPMKPLAALAAAAADS
jgi:hypothetical protein